jgi:hypothetical protein
MHLQLKPQKEGDMYMRQAYSYMKEQEKGNSVSVDIYHQIISLKNTFVRNCGK